MGNSPPLHSKNSREKHCTCRSIRKHLSKCLLLPKSCNVQKKFGIVLAHQKKSWTNHWIFRGVGQFPPPLHSKNGREKHCSSRSIGKHLSKCLLLSRSCNVQKKIGVALAHQRNHALTKGEKKRNSCPQKLFLPHCSTS